MIETTTLGTLSLAALTALLGLWACYQSRAALDFRWQTNQGMSFFEAIVAPDLGWLARRQRHFETPCLGAGFELVDFVVAPSWRQ